MDITPIDLTWADQQLPKGITRHDVCIWMEDSDGAWSASCGLSFQFIHDGPRENQAYFCQHCGGVLLPEYHCEDDPE